MWPNCIVVPTPGFNDYLRFAAAAEPLDAQALVTELAIEALIHPVLPRLARVDQRGLNAGAVEPFENRPANEFGTIVRSQIVSNRRPTSYDS